jgi:hypothetical protein
MKKVFPFAMALIAVVTGLASARPLGHEAQSVIDALLATPTIKAEPGFRAKMFIRPGELYDPLFMVPRGNTILMNDDGKAIGDHGGRILSITPQGRISVVMDADQLLPIVALDEAPRGFGQFGGQFFSLAQPTSGMKGAVVNHVIERINLDKRTAVVFCTLPNAGKVGNGVPGYGFDGHFGPEGSGFANIFYSTTALNDMIYQTHADGSCKPFADTSQFGAAGAITFTPDGSAMLVTTSTDTLPSAGTAPKGAIIRISSDGKIDPKPIVTGLIGPAGIAVAPPNFGKYGGQIFVTDAADFEFPVPQTQPLKRDGKVYRVTPQGELKLVASGFINPGGLRFIGTHLWVTDINGDFIAGMRELPDGFVVQLEAM